MTSGILSARAVALFNPTSEPGFLQPLFAGGRGDNRTYVQIFSAPDHLDGLIDVAWPERDVAGLINEPIVEIGGETLWAFQFPGDDRIVDHWNGFREFMRGRIADPVLADRPLLLFDIVDTLEIAEARRDVFTRAYRTYAAMHGDAADRWRNRAILEPALAKAISEPEGSFDREGIEPGDPRAFVYRPSFRIESDGAQTRLVSQKPLRKVDMQRLSEAYEALIREFPEILPKNFKIVPTTRPPAATTPFEMPVTFRVILTGRLQTTALRQDWLSEDVEVISGSHFHPQLRTGRKPDLTIILGMQTDWGEMVRMSLTMGADQAIIISLSSARLPLLRDFEFQSKVQHPTITLFAPYSGGARDRRDPISSIKPLLRILRHEMKEEPTTLIQRLFKARHNVFLRERIVEEDAPIEAGCRLAAKALKSGSRVDGQARLYVEGGLFFEADMAWCSIFDPMFTMESRYPLEVDAPASTLHLLVERDEFGRGDKEGARMIRGIRRIFEMRGWTVSEGTRGSFEIEAEDRRFSVLVVGDGKQTPLENDLYPNPGLTRAPLLILHSQGNRDQLLIGNRGQFFHATPEDIALMVPGTMWVWPILRKQLFDKRPHVSQSMLRLTAALVVEAIRMDRFDATPHIGWGWISNCLSSADCERFIAFVEQRGPKNPVILEIRTQHSDDGAANSVRVAFSILDDGPQVSVLAPASKQQDLF